MARSVKSNASSGSVACGPDFEFEHAFWRAGIQCVAGVDEVGRGAIAGPLVAAAVVLPRCEGAALHELRARLADVRDSKLLRPGARRALLPVICGVAEAVAVGVVQADELDAIGLGPANRLAMERAVVNLPVAAEALLLDACVLDLGLPQVGMIDGDARCMSIAAASIVAKVTRDRFMVEAGATDRRYGFAEHKGYGTASHLDAVREHGAGPLHRRCFAPIRAQTFEDSA